VGECDGAEDADVAAALVEGADTGVANDQAGTDVQGRAIADRVDADRLRVALAEFQKGSEVEAAALIEHAVGEGPGACATSTDSFGVGTQRSTDQAHSAAGVGGKADDK